MPSTSLHAVETVSEVRRRRDRVARLERLADTLDARFNIPVLGIPIGWDSIIGLVPGVGDIVTALPGVAMFYEVRRIGGRKRAAVRIATNTGIDLALGAVPLLGDAFDVFFKSHKRNVAILRAELDRIEKGRA